MNILTKYGYGTLGIVAIFCFILFAIAIFSNNNILKYTLISIAILLLGFTLNFFRDPDRTTPQNERAIISPADGTVLVIKDVVSDRFIEGEAQQISIFMSPMNVHVNRIPINGTVDYLEYINGEYLIASHDKADKRNERNEVGITSKFGKVLFTQVAGMMARRIICDLTPGDSVIAGERFGMIKFGSRVDVIVSKDWTLKVKEGDKVTAGESILFEYNK